MHKSLYVFAAAATLCLATGASQAMPVTGGAMKDVLDTTNMVEKTAVYVVEGRRYCFYFDGWRGAGWYRCGFAHRRGLGWGGVYGWQGWDYGPAARKFGHHRGGVTIREGGRRMHRGDTMREGSTNRERSTTREGGRDRGDVQHRGTTAREGTSARGGASMRGETMGGGGKGGAKAGGEVKGGGEMNRSPGGAGRGGDEGGRGGDGGGRGGDAGGRGGDKQ